MAQTKRIVGSGDENVSESNLPNNVFTCAKSSWGEFGGLYHEVITKGFELCLRISISALFNSYLVHLRPSHQSGTSTAVVS